MNSFKIENARVTRVTSRPKVAYLTLLAASDRQGMTTYFDVVVFTTNGLTIPAEGASVSVSGTLGRRKPQTGTAWTTELIARAIEAGDEGVTPAAPVRAPYDRAEPKRATGPRVAEDYDVRGRAAADLLKASEDDIPF